jgi:hypothetical protein
MVPMLKLSLIICLAVIESIRTLFGELLMHRATLKNLLAGLDDDVQAAIKNDPEIAALFAKVQKRGVALAEMIPDVGEIFGDDVEAWTAPTHFQVIIYNNNTGHLLSSPIRHNVVVSGDGYAFYELGGNLAFTLDEKKAKTLFNGYAIHVPHHGLIVPCRWEEES